MGDPSGGSVFVACRFRFRHGGQNASRIKGRRKDLAITIMRCRWPGSAGINGHGRRPLLARLGP